jgi:hypothetical protein
MIVVTFIWGMYYKTLEIRNLWEMVRFRSKLESSGLAKIRIKGLVKIARMEQHVFCIFFDYRGHHRKVVEIYNATSVNSQQKLWFH